jgi:uridine phosphorylase
MDLPLLETDQDDEGIIEPARIVGSQHLPERGVLCFFGDVVSEMIATRNGSRHVASLSSEAGSTPVWEIQMNGRPLAVFQPGVGAPMAAAFLEEAIAMGCSSVVACGGAGALIPDLVLGHPIVVDSAVRDEGTSYHYLSPARTVQAASGPVSALVRTLDAAQIGHVVGRTWTTDAIYRETRSRVDRRVTEQCLVVEMEAAALLAVAHYRRIAYGHVLMAGDSLAGQDWDERSWRSARQAREKLFWAAAQAAMTLP